MPTSDCIDGHRINADVFLDRTARRLAEENGARLRKLVQQIGNLHRLADGGVFDVATLGAPADDEDSSVHAHLQIGTVLLCIANERKLLELALNRKRAE